MAHLSLLRTQLLDIVVFLDLKIPNRISLNRVTDLRSPEIFLCLCSPEKRPFGIVTNCGWASLNGARSKIIKNCLRGRRGYGSFGGYKELRGLGLGSTGPTLDL